MKGVFCGYSRLFMTLLLGTMLCGCPRGVPPTGDNDSTTEDDVMSGDNDTPAEGIACVVGAEAAA